MIVIGSSGVSRSSGPAGAADRWSRSALTALGVGGRRQLGVSEGRQVLPESTVERPLAARITPSCCQTTSDACHLASKRAVLVQEIGPSSALGRARTPAKLGIRWPQTRSNLCTKLQYRCLSAQPSLLRRPETSSLRLGSYMIHTTRLTDRRSQETAWIWAGSPRKRELVSDHIGSHNRAAGGDLVGKSAGILACVSSASCRQAIA